MSRLEIAVALLCAELGQNGIPDLLYTEEGAKGLQEQVDEAKEQIERAFRMADLVLERSAHLEVKPAEVKPAWTRADSRTPDL